MSLWKLPLCIINIFEGILGTFLGLPILLVDLDLLTLTGWSFGKSDSTFLLLLSIETGQTEV